MSSVDRPPSGVIGSTAGPGPDASASPAVVALPAEAPREALLDRPVRRRVDGVRRLDDEARDV